MKRTHTHSQTHLLRKKLEHSHSPRPLFAYISLAFSVSIYFTVSLIFTMQALYYFSCNRSYCTLLLMLLFIQFFLLYFISLYSFLFLIIFDVNTHIAGRVKWESFVAHQNFIFTRINSMNRAFHCCCFLFLLVVTSLI